MARLMDKVLKKDRDAEKHGIEFPFCVTGFVTEKEYKDRKCDGAVLGRFKTYREAMAYGQVKCDDGSDYHTIKVTIA